MCFINIFKKTEKIFHSVFQYINTIYTSNMQLFVKTLTGKTLTFYVNSDDTFGSFRKKIAQKMNLPLDLIDIIIEGKCANHTDDDKQISEYNLQRIEWVHAIKRTEKIQLFVKTLEGETLTFDIDQHQTFGSFRKQIAQRMNLSPENTLVVVDMHEAKPSDDTKMLSELKLCVSSGIQACERHVSTTTDDANSPRPWFLRWF